MAPVLCDRAPAGAAKDLISSFYPESVTLKSKPGPGALSSLSIPACLRMPICLPVRFFPLHIKNEFYCFFGVGKRFTLAGRSRDLNAPNGEPPLFLWFEHCRIFHDCIVDRADYTRFFGGCLSSSTSSDRDEQCSTGCACGVSFHRGVNAVETGNNM
jgi:hypothetical protein